MEGAMKKLYITLVIVFVLGVIGLIVFGNSRFEKDVDSEKAKSEKILRENSVNKSKPLLLRSDLQKQLGKESIRNAIKKMKLKKNMESQSQCSGKSVEKSEEIPDSKK